MKLNDFLSARLITPPLLQSLTALRSALIQIPDRTPLHQQCAWLLASRLDFDQANTNGGRTVSAKGNAVPRFYEQN
jgi:hypothetical protein